MLLVTLAAVPTMGTTVFVPSFATTLTCASLPASGTTVNCTSESDARSAMMPPDGAPALTSRAPTALPAASTYDARTLPPASASTRTCIAVLANEADTRISPTTWSMIQLVPLPL